MEKRHKVTAASEGSDFGVRKRMPSKSPFSDALKAESAYRTITRAFRGFDSRWDYGGCGGTVEEPLPPTFFAPHFVRPYYVFFLFHFVTVP
jgi:hypothetical protein